MRPSAGNGRYPQTAKCSRSVPEKLYPVVQPYCYHCGSPLADTETEYCQNCRKHRSFVAEGRSLLYIVGLCRNPCTGLSMQTGGDMPVFWRRKPCSAGKTGCGKKDRSNRSGTDVFEKERYRGYNQAALFGRALSEKWIFRVFRV